jgi:hypothetical protein
MTICRLVYMSERNLSAALDLDQVLRTSQRNNHRVGVTGFLMFDGQYFAQCLEGSRTYVTHTYNRIVGDVRHTNIHLVSCSDVNDRLFPTWSMGLLDGISSEARDRFLAYFTLERINPNKITIDRLLFFMQALAAEKGSDILPDWAKQSAPPMAAAAE